MLYRHTNSDRIIIIIEKKRLICAAVGKGSHKPYTLTHFTLFSAPFLAHTGSLINTTTIGTQIAKFIQTYKLHRSFISVICTDPIIQEGFAATTTASAQQYLHHNLAQPHTTLNTIYLGPYQEKFLHWWHRISYPLLLQLQLLAYQHHLNIVRIISPFPLLLELYARIRGASFHPVQLISDLAHKNFNLATMVDSSLLKNFLYYEPYATTIDVEIVPLLVGALLYEEK